MNEFIDKRIQEPRDIIDIQKTVPDFVIRDDAVVIAYHKKDKSGYLVAAITDHNGVSCEVTGMAKGKWFHTSIYSDLFGFIFKDLRCQRINFVVDKDNHKCIDLLEKGGCVRECELRGVGRYLYSMIPEDFYNG